MKRHAIATAISLVFSSLLVTACGGNDNTSEAALATTPKNVLFFLGDGMGMTTMTAARIYAVGESGDLTMDTLPETAFIKTFSKNSQVTDSAPSMAAYMTGVKMNNEVISMSADTTAYNTATLEDYVKDADTTCPTSGNGAPVTTLLELAKTAGLATGVVSTARITHATPAATYAHVCHRDAENTIANQVVPKGAGFNAALGDGVDVLMGGGLRHFLPKGAGSSRTDSRDLVAEMKQAGYGYAVNKTELDALPKTGKLLGLFSSSHMAYDLDRTSNQPSLSDMTARAIDQLKGNSKGMFLMVEGGRIDHALHETTARKALQDTVAFDTAVKTAIEKMQVIDPGLKNTLIIATADHDHTMVLNGYAALTGKTTDTNPGVLGLMRGYKNNAVVAKDTGGNPFTIIGFGNGENRVATRTSLTDAAVFDKAYHQEATIPTAVGSETHGGADIFLGATGKGAENFSGVMDNTAVFGLIRKSIGL